MALKDLNKELERHQYRQKLFNYNLEQAKENGYIVFSGQLYSSKNSRRIFGNKAVKSKTALLQEGDFERQLYLQKENWIELLKKYKSKYPLKLSFEIFRSDARRFDYTNMIQGLCDGLVKAGYLEDDSADYLIPVFLPYKIDRVNPRTLIRIGS